MSRFDRPIHHDPGTPAQSGAPTSRGAGPPGRPPDHAPGSFTGAALPICGVEALIVVVHPWVLADVHAANLYVVAFHERFRRIIVLMAQGPGGAPCFYGPANLVRVLHGLPLEMIPWRRLLYRTAPPPSWRLPIPQPRARARAGPAGDLASSLVPRGADRSGAAPTVNGRGDRAARPARIGGTDRTRAH
jgi:hypothetical protein